MSIPSAITDSSLLDDLGDLSLYEDALEDSDEEWRKFHREAMFHITKVEEQAKRKKPVNLLESSLPPKHGIQHQSSSSENSSIERLNPEAIRSRRGTGMTPKRRSHKSGNSSTSNGGVATPDEWKLINFAFQEAASYPILFQLNQQLQAISNQLTDLACSNSIQLRATYRLIRAVIKYDRQQQESLKFWKRFAMILFTMAISPFFFKLLCRFQQLKQNRLGRVMLKYL
uniref:Uncharacterized protein n=1 Tax=Panagrolaimus sp. JU765 TaxID=591449 RepID=A0AC34QHL5_9BILA